MSSKGEMGVGSGPVSDSALWDERRTMHRAVGDHCHRARRATRGRYDNLKPGRLRLALPRSHFSEPRKRLPALFAPEATRAFAKTRFGVGGVIESQMLRARLRLV